METLIFMSKVLGLGGLGVWGLIVYDLLYTFQHVVNLADVKLIKTHNSKFKKN